MKTLRALRLLTFVALAACGGGGSGDPDAAMAPNDLSTDDLSTSADLSTPATIVVHGTVLDNGSAPIAAVIVSVGGKLAVTDAAGKFTIEVAQVPYDLMLGGRLQGLLHGWFYNGLTRLDPTLHLDDIFPTSPQKSGKVSGSFSGVTSPLTAGQSGYLFSTSSQTQFYANGSALTFTEFVDSWTGTTATHADTLAGLFWSGTPGNVTYLGYGKTDVVVDSVTPLLSVAIALTAPSAVALTGTINVVSAGSYTFSPTVRIGSGQCPLDTFTSSTAALSYKTPDIAGATIDWRVDASIGMRTARAVGWGFQPNAAIPAINLGGAVALVKPVNNATAVAPTSMFEIMPTAATGQVHYLSFVDPPANVLWTLVTASSTFSFPDGAPIGMPMPKAGELVGWQATSYPVANVDAAADAKNITRGAFRESVAAGVPYIVTDSEFFQFSM